MKVWTILIAMLPFIGDRAEAQKYEVLSKQDSMIVGLSVGILGPASDGKSVVRVEYHDDSQPQGTSLASIILATSELANGHQLSGQTFTRYPLPGCNIPLIKKGQYSYKNGVFEIETAVTPEETATWKPECRGTFAQTVAKFRVTFPALTQKDRAAFGLFSDKEMENCKFIHGDVLSLDGIEGKELTAYPNGWAHDVDGYYTGSQSWADMTVNTLVQTGPQNWANERSYVFLLGDKVTVQRVVKAPKPGVSGGFVRTRLVEVKRNSDGLVAVVDLGQFFWGSLDG